MHTLTTGVKVTTCFRKTCMEPLTLTIAALAFAVVAALVGGKRYNKKQETSNRLVEEAKLRAMKRMHERKTAEPQVERGAPLDFGVSAVEIIHDRHDGRDFLDRQQQITVELLMTPDQAWMDTVR